MVPHRSRPRQLISGGGRITTDRSMTNLLGFTGDLFLGHDSTSAFCLLGAQLGPQVRLVVNFEGTLFDHGDALHPSRRKILLTSPLKALMRSP